MSDITKETCVKFVRADIKKDKSYVKITNDRQCDKTGVVGGCWSWIGKQSKQPQQLNLETPGCIGHGIILHELMHALGFKHEQSRPDRDEYITVLWDNIISNKQYNFNKSTNIDQLGTPYDLCSVMHYGLTQFSKVNKI